MDTLNATGGEAPVTAESFQQRSPLHRLWWNLMLTKDALGSVRDEFERVARFSGPDVTVTPSLWELIYRFRDDYFAVLKAIPATSALLDGNDPPTECYTTRLRVDLNRMVKALPGPDDDPAEPHGAVEQPVLFRDLPEQADALLALIQEHLGVVRAMMDVIAAAPQAKPTVSDPDAVSNRSTDGASAGAAPPPLDLKLHPRALRVLCYLRIAPAKATITMIAANAGDEGGTYSRNSVSRSLRELESDGFVSVERGLWSITSNGAALVNRK